jgi:SAM-dependent methyltransferase
MERQAFDRMAELDGKHWWYRARRDILSDVIARRVRPPADARILEIGCGTGHNLAMLGQFGRLEAVELDDAARTLAEQRLGRPIANDALPGLADTMPGPFDLIALLDVLEHVPDDRGALAAIRRMLAPTGALVVSVPANPWMWTAHDAVHHHHRRYRKSELAERAAEAGFGIDLLTHFNSLLFPPIAAVRLLGKITGKQESDDRLPSPAVNGLLERLFGAERQLVGRVPLPFGVSLLAVLRPR